jgi:hypothetical protein
LTLGRSNAGSRRWGRQSTAAALLDRRTRIRQRIDMGDTSLIRAALLIALITAFGLAATGRAPATEAPAAAVAAPASPAG